MKLNMHMYIMHGMNKVEFCLKLFTKDSAVVMIGPAPEPVDINAPRPDSNFKF